VLLAVRPPDGLSARNVLPAVVTEVGLKENPVVEIRLDAGGATLISQITRETVDALGIEAGRRVYAIVKAVAFDRSTLGSGLGPASERRSDIVDV